MARPSQQIDQALLDAGAEEIRLKGVRGLSVRTVCARAGVSPRMLNYYFESKDNFVRTLLVRGYTNFSREVEEAVRGEDDPLDRLARGVRVCLRHTLEGRLVLRNLICDAYADEPVVSALLRGQNSHTRIMFSLMEEAWRRGELRKDCSPAEIFMATVPGVFQLALQMDSPFPFNLRHIRELGGLHTTQTPISPEELTREVDHGMAIYERLMSGFRLKKDGTDPARGLRSKRRADRRGPLITRRLALAQSTHRQSGKKTADGAKKHAPWHIVHHAENTGKNAQ